MSHSHNAIGAISVIYVEKYLDVPTPNWQGMGDGKPIPVDFKIRRFAVEGKFSVRFREMAKLYTDILCGKQKGFEG